MLYMLLLIMIKLITTQKQLLWLHVSIGEASVCRVQLNREDYPENYAHR